MTELEVKIVDIEPYRAEMSRIFKKMAKEHQITQEEFNYINKDGLKEVLDQTGIRIV